MKRHLRRIERESGIEIYGLGLDRAKWQACLEKMTDLIIDECCRSLNPMLRDMISRGQAVQLINDHFKEDMTSFEDNVKAGAELHADIFDDKEGYSLGDPDKQRAFANARRRSMIIGQLAEEATRAVERRPDTGICVMDEYNAKFADLIIRKCAEIAKQCIEDEWFDVSNAILEEFGLEK